MKKTHLLLFIAIIATLNLQAQFNSNVIEYLDINNVRAGYLLHGDMFWNPNTATPSYEFPKGSGKHSNFGASIWIGGIDQSTNGLKVATQTYRQTGHDYWPGPLDEFNSASISVNWAQIWKVNKSTIDSFRQLSAHTLSNTPKSILEWPGRMSQYAKTPSNGMLAIPDRTMAPFVDINNDNIYNPLDGDYPDIKGDQMLWWVFNDKAFLKTNSGSNAIGLEIHASAYACTKAGLENTTFINYKLMNWNTSILDSTIVTLWNGVDLGFGGDDYIGFDSTYRMGIAYNGDNFDETNIGYGQNLTQTAVVLLRQVGDNATSRLPAGSYTYYYNSNLPSTVTSPNDYYGFMNGNWTNGRPLRAGCNPNDTSQAIAKYAFPDDPSIVAGISEVHCSMAPSDRTTTLSSKSFALLPGAAPMEFTYAFINTDTGVNNSNFNELRRLADSAYKYVDGCGGALWPLGLPNISKSDLKVYPNPSNDFFIIEDEEKKDKQITLYNSYGQTIYKTTSKQLKTTINTTPYSKGVYFLKIDQEGRRYSQSILIE